MRVLVDALAQASQDELRRATGTEHLGLQNEAKARVDLAVDQSLERQLLVRHRAQDRQRPRAGGEPSGAQGLAERLGGRGPERSQRPLRRGGLGDVGGGEARRRPARFGVEMRRADEAQHRRAHPHVAVVPMREEHRRLGRDPPTVSFGDVRERERGVRPVVGVFQAGRQALQMPDGIG